MNNKRKYVEEIHKIAYHRNGICGEPFCVILFSSIDDDGKSRDMVGVVFDEPYYVAVFNKTLLDNNVIEFTKNSWRGDRFEPELRAAIEEWERVESQPKS